MKILSTSQPFFLLFIALTFAVSVDAKTTRSQTTGIWENATTWDSGLPAGGDDITIQAGDIVAVTTNNASLSCCATVIHIYGTLHFSGSGDKLHLGCGSTVVIHPGGQITGGGGGGASNQLTICGTEVWRTSDGAISGPMTFGTPLPVELLSFEAHSNGSSVDIKWITATESNSSHFELERSTDGINYETIMITAAAGESQEVITYFEKDPNPTSGVNYYRLKQVDNNGATFTSSATAIKHYDNFDNNVVLFPNPASNIDEVQMTIADLKDEEILVVLRDIQGKEMYSKIHVIQTDNEIIGFSDSDDLKPGTYLVTASSANVLFSKRLIIK